MIVRFSFRAFVSVSYYLPRWAWAVSWDAEALGISDLPSELASVLVI